MSTFIAEKSQQNSNENSNESSNVTKIDDLDINNIVFTIPKIGKNKKLTAAIIDKKKSSGLYIQSCILATVFNIDYFGSKGSKEIKEEDRQWSFLLRPLKNTNDHDKLYSFLTDLNNECLEWGVKHSPLIFNKKNLNKEKVELLFTSGFKPNIGKDGTVYPEQINVKIMKDKDTFKPNVLVFKDSLNPIALDSWEQLQATIPANSLIQLIFQPQVGFNSSGSFGINFKTLQILVFDSKKPSRPTSYAFSKLPDIATKCILNDEENDENNKNTKDLEENTKDSEENSDYEVEINDD